ncbi:FAD-dependent oxidoreductase [Virgibacillus sp. DJP39]|uniref:FAD-dependent oxidoreductase n=1 Tax=Virgibacillus sp. DJP39 TaxID=3409790 RepID=UPI003BB59A5F
MKNKYIFVAVITILSIACFLVFNNTDSPKESNQNDKVNSPNKPDNKYEVIVIGGEPEGIAAAVSAARNGAKTLLINERKELGGLFTYGMLNYLDIPQGGDGESVSKGIFEEWHKLVGGGNAFGISEAKATFKKLVVEEPNITLLTETKVLDSVVKDNKVEAVKIKNKNGEYEIKGKTFIDATQDADFAVLSGAPYFVGGEDIGIEDKKMSVTLMIHLKNINWEKIRETAKSEKFGSAVVTDQVAWGFTTLHFDYKPVDKNTRLRGLNIAKIKDDYYINALQIFGVDGLDDDSKQKAIERGKRETRHILEYLQDEFPGFKNAEIAGFPTELYVRETRHIIAEYQLPMSDVWMNKDHWDSIGFGAYPVDIQAKSTEDYGKILAVPKQYAIPFRSLVPKKINGLLVVGRSAGYSSLAAGSARIVPTGMVVGEAAGAAASISVNKSVSFRAMTESKVLINKLRNTLDNQGALVKHIVTDYPYMGKWYDQSVQTLFDYGLAFGGYENDLKVDKVATFYDFMEIVKGAVERVNPKVSKQLDVKISTINTSIMEKDNRPIKRDEAAALLAELFFEETENENWKLLIDKGLINESLANRLGKNRELKFKEIYAIGASVISYIQDSI